MKNYLQKLLPNINKIKKIQGEASNRAFFRLYFDSHTRIALVYPDENPGEIARIATLTSVYRERGIGVPHIHEVLDNRVVIQDDLGDQLLQRTFSRATKNEKIELIEKVAAILGKLYHIPTKHTDRILGPERLRWEMDYFLRHFAHNFFPEHINRETLRGKLYEMVGKIQNISNFAHRDFHSRNMLYLDGEIYLVDFQDSLVASPLYDLVSFTYDAYLDLKKLKPLLIEKFQEHCGPIDREQLLLTALQRNIKALGTFGYQVFERNNLTYKKYIDRTLRHIWSNDLFHDLLGETVFPTKTITT